MKRKERNLRDVVRNFPNLIDPMLRPMPLGRVGDINVCLQEEPLPECGGRLDIAFVTNKTVYLVELKKRDVGPAAAKQILSYLAALSIRYPLHEVRGFLVGTRLKNEEGVASVLEGQGVQMLLFGRELPALNRITACPACRAGMDVARNVCPVCGG
ncbi:MAG: hypothetical protein HY913_16575 [Desulfomonile tiedjei]|nr:hypothetical protein [Desulfomonile tiedjei]